MTLLKKFKVIIILLSFIIALFVRLEGFNQLLIDAYYFRQAHTATVARNFFQDGIDMLRVRLDWFGLGKEQYLIQEFPVYQAIVAGLSYIFGFSTQLARLVSIFFGLLAGLCLFVIMYFVSKDTLKSYLALIFFWFFPLAIFVHHALMSESLNVFLHLVTIVVWLCFLRSEKIWIMLLFIPLAIVATIAKITYGPFLLLFIVLLGLIYKGKTYYLKPQILLCFFIITLGTIYWQHSADSMNSTSGNAFYTSQNPINLIWNMGYFSERLVFHTWQRRFGEILGSITKISVLMSFIGVLALLRYKNKETYIFLGWLLIMVLYYLIFFRIQNHIYYFHIVTPVVAVLAAYGLETTFKKIRNLSKYGAYIFLLVFLLFFVYKGYHNSRGYFVPHKDVERKLGIMNQYLTIPGPMVLVFPVWDWHSVYTYYTGRKAIVITLEQLGDLDRYRQQGYAYVVFQDFSPGLIDQNVLKENKLQLIHEDSGILIAQLS